MTDSTLWAVFWVMTVAMLAIDLGLVNRKPHAMAFREAMAWVVVWIVVAALFCLALYLWAENGTQRTQEFLAAYITEKALSVDNIFVFVVVFRSFAIRPEHQHRVLFWGIFGAIVLRGVFIFVGVELTERFAWSLYVLGAFLIFTGIKLGFEKEREIHPEGNLALRLAKRFLPVTSQTQGANFFLRSGGKLLATPHFLALVVIESTDVMFAVDSVPAALSISSDRLVLYSSNILAIMGLRALYFAVAEAMTSLRFLQAGLSAILVFVGIKMLLAHSYHIPVGWALSTVGGILVITIGASLLYKPRSGTK